MNIECVCINAFMSDENGDHYCDAEENTPTGWTVYLRTVADSGGTFDVPKEWDFKTEDEALEWADSMASLYCVPVHAY